MSKIPQNERLRAKQTAEKLGEAVGSVESIEETDELARPHDMSRKVGPGG